MATTRGKSLSQKGEHRWADAPRAAPLRHFKVNLSVSPPAGAVLGRKGSATSVRDTPVAVNVTYRGLIQSDRVIVLPASCPNRVASHNPVVLEPRCGPQESK
jgi:hypothetical protein